MNFISPALQVLKQYAGENETNLKLLLSNHLNRISNGNESQSDSIRYTVTRTVYGVIRHIKLLDYLIGQCSDRPLNRIQSDIKILLEIGAFLLLFSSSYPDYAVLNETVSASPKKTRSFVNAVLRNMTRNKEKLFGSIDKIEDPTIRFSVSPAIVHHLKKLSPNWIDDLKYLDSEPAFHIRFDPRVLDYIKAGEILNSHRIEFKELHAFKSFELKEVRRVLHELMDSYPFFVQDAGSQSISIIASQYARSLVADVCAAPGTKSVTLALLNPSIPIIANDIDFGRVRLIKETITRLNIHSIYPVVSDARNPGFSHKISSQMNKNPDFIIVDAPCTSSGTLRKSPDLKLKINENSISRNAGLQYEIIAPWFNEVNTFWNYLLYSVCSFIYDETEAVMNRISQIAKDFNYDSFEWIDLSSELQSLGFNFIRAEKGFYLMPGPLNNDIFYLSLIKKSK